MPDEIGTEATRPDAPSADESPFGVAEDKTAAVVEEDSKGKAEQDSQAADDTGKETAPAEDLKVVLSIKGGRATIGVQRPSSDPHVESFDDADLSRLAQEVPAVTERARARWEDEPKHPAYERPAPPPRSWNRRQQGAAQDATAEETERSQPETPRLF